MNACRDETLIIYAQVALSQIREHIMDECHEKASITYEQIPAIKKANFIDSCRKRAQLIDLQYPKNIYFSF